jgi:hypothetical protein
MRRNFVIIFAADFLVFFVAEVVEAGMFTMQLAECLSGEPVDPTHSIPL